MASVNICSDFGSPQIVCHSFHCFPIYLPWSNGTRCHDLSPLNVEFKANFFTLLFHFHQAAAPAPCSHVPVQPDKQYQFSSVQSLSRVQLLVTPWLAACQASLSMTIFRSSLRLTYIESVMPSSHLILCRPLFLLPSIPPSISLFQWVNSSHVVAISLLSKELSRVFSNTTVQKHQFLALSFLHSPTLTSIHDHWKNHSFD